MKIGLAGPGAFGIKHLDGLKNIDGADVSVIIDPNLDHAKDVAGKYGVPNAVDDLGEALQMDDLDAVILCTPTQLHAEQAIQCMEAGKHVEVEIPVADTLADAEAVDAKQKETGLVCAVGHTRRFNPSHQWVHQKIQAGELSIHGSFAGRRLFDGILGQSQLRRCLCAATEALGRTLRIRERRGCERDAGEQGCLDASRQLRGDSQWSGACFRPPP